MSHLKGESTPPLLDLHLDQLFRSTVSTHPHELALVSVEQGRRFSYTQFEERVAEAACGLHRLGLRKGDRLGTWLPNVYEYAVLQWASARIGVVLVTVNPAYRVPDLIHVLNTVSCKAIAMVPSYRGTDYVSMMNEAGPHLHHLQHIFVVGVEHQEQLAVATRIKTDAHAHSYVGVLEAPAAGDGGGDGDSDGDGDGDGDGDSTSAASLCEIEAISSTLDLHDIINIQFTSGTTGLPKAVALTHHNIVNNGYLVGKAQNLSVSDTICLSVPMHHCFGLVMGSITSVTVGATLVFPSSVFDPHATLKAVVAERCTALYGVPTMFIAELNCEGFASYDLSSLRTGIMAGTTCPAEVMRRVIQDMYMSEITICYGMTETSPVSWQSVKGSPFQKLVGTVGKILPHTECKVVDEAGQVVPLGVAGELMTRGYLVMDGYWKDAEATREVLTDDGWIRTGDIAVVDGDGYARIDGRIKDIIIRGGENIAPREVEDCLIKSEFVDVVSVVAVEDTMFGEQLCACVIVPKSSASFDEEGLVAELKAHCKREHLPGFKIPKYFRIVDQFPMTISGKVQKNILAADSQYLKDTCGGVPGWVK